MSSERHLLRDRFHKLFTEEAKLRPERSGHTDDGELEWVWLEAEAMLTSVNTARANRGKSPITRERYERMETCCMGHCDYHSKLALGCMELVLDED